MPPSVADTPVFPALNATLNGAAAVLLLLGLVFIKRKNVAAHRACLLGALGVSAAFLVSYLWYHANYGSRGFEGKGWIRPVYFTILFSHTALAAAVVPLALVSARRGLRGDVERHRRVARYAWPIWMYVSVTGVVIYFMLYRLAP